MKISEEHFYGLIPELHRRISLFISLPFDKLSNLALKEKLDEIGAYAMIDASADDAPGYYAVNVAARINQRR